MKLLISAYACRPNMGSEPAVGWNWVCQLCKANEVVVLTNYTNKSYIEEYISINTNTLGTVRFVYVKPKNTFWYKEWSRGERLYYYFWQHKAYRVAKELVSREHFDVVQHLTYVTCIMPTYMHKLGIPFVYGPISGGERIPSIIRYPLGLKDKLIEFVRLCTQIIPKISPNAYQTFKNANRIVVVTEDTLQLVPQTCKDKTVIMQAIGLDDLYFSIEPKFLKQSEKMKILMAGRMLPWKGFELGISSVKKAIKQGANISLTILGNGSKRYIQKLKRLSENLDDGKIQFIENVPYEKMREFYDQFDILLNCSLRDSGCMVVMEAMGRGLPVVCVDTGGPQVNTSEDCAIKIKPRPFEELSNEIAEALYELSRDPQKREKMSRAAYFIAQSKFRNSAKIEEFQEIYAGAVGDK